MEASVSPVVSQLKKRSKKSARMECFDRLSIVVGKGSHEAHSEGARAVNGNPKTVVSAKQARGLRPRLTPPQSILFAMTILAAGGLVVPIALANPVMDPDIHLAAYHQEGRPIRLTRTGQLASDDKGTAYDVVPVYGADRVGLNDGYQLVEAGDGGPTVVGRLWGKLTKSLGFAGPDWDADALGGEISRASLEGKEGPERKLIFLQIADAIEQVTGDPLTAEAIPENAEKLVRHGFIPPSDEQAWKDAVVRRSRARHLADLTLLSKATKQPTFGAGA